MSRFGMAHVALAAVITAVVPGASAAEEPNTVRADALVQEGNKLGADSKFEQAISKWAAADAIVRRPIHACNIGLAYVRLSFWAQAHYYLSRCQSTWSDGELPDWVGRRLSESENAFTGGAYGQTTVAVSPSSATWTISFLGDSEVLTGGHELWVPHGTHSIVAKAEGYRQATVALIVRDQKPKPVAIALEPLPSEPAITKLDPPADGGSPAPAPGRIEMSPGPQDGNRSHNRTWLYSGIGTGALTVGLGALGFVFRGAASDRFESAEDPGGYDEDINAAERINTYDGYVDDINKYNALAASAWIGAGVSAGLTGYFLYRAFAGSVDEEQPLTFAPTPGGAQVSARWHF